MPYTVVKRWPLHDRDGDRQGRSQHQHQQNGFSAGRHIVA
jgi:hypothetical protein